MCTSVILFVLFYCLCLYCVILLLCNLSQEFPSGLISSILSYLIMVNIHSVSCFVHWFAQTSKFSRQYNVKVTTLHDHWT